jgi:hypothetical protein
MKRFFTKTAFVVALASMASIGHAQIMSVSSGSTTVQLSTAFINSLGANVTDLQGNPLTNNTITFQAASGALDLSLAAGEVQHKGGIIINARGMQIRLENWTIDTSTPTASIISAEFVMNGHFDFRLPLFDVQPPPGFVIPLTLQSGALQINGLTLTIAPATEFALSALFGGPVVHTGASAGTANTSVVFSSQSSQY